MDPSCTCESGPCIDDRLLVRDRAQSYRSVPGKVCDWFHRERWMRRRSRQTCKDSCSFPQKECLKHRGGWMTSGLECIAVRFRDRAVRVKVKRGGTQRTLSPRYVLGASKPPSAMIFLAYSCDSSVLPERA